MSASTEFLSPIGTPSSPAPAIAPPSSKVPAEYSSAAPGSTDMPDNPSSAPSSQKRHFEFSLPSDGSVHPTKRAKKIITSVSAKREQAVEDLHAHRMLQLARATREAFVAQAKYRETRIHELDVMRTIAHDEYEEAVSLVKVAELQIDEIQRFLASNGIHITTLSSLRLSPVFTAHHVSFSEGVSGVTGISPSPFPS